MAELLPANASALERHLAHAGDPLHLPVEHARLWDVERCPPTLLGYLAWTLSVDFWELAESTEQRRNLVRGALAWHRKRGTPWAIRQALAAHGYPDCELVEHAQLQRQWLQAGGELLEGDNTLDGSSDLSAPEGSFRFTTRHWAEYALRLNAVERETTPAMLRRIAALCSAYAPARSQLAAIVLVAAARFQSQPQLLGYRGRARLRLRRCTRIAVPGFATLDGCGPLGGHHLPAQLDGSSRLDGHGQLRPTRPAGEPLGPGPIRITQRLRLALQGPAAGGRYLEPAERLDGTNALDGTSNLGATLGPPCIGFIGRLRLRHGPHQTQEPL